MTTWRRLECASAFPLLLALVAVLPASAQKTDADKIHERLSKLPPNAEVEVHKTDGAVRQGTLERFDRSELVLSTQPQPIPLSDIRKVKRIRSQGPGPAWNPATGFMRSWKMAAIAGGLILALGFLVAYGTE